VDTADLESMKEALTETLVRKMRAAFAGDGDALAEDIVGEEVVAFMTHNGSTRASEIEALEARIAARLEAERGATGANGAESAPSRVAPRRDAPPKTSRRFDPNGVRDEWAEISKWHSREGERLEAEALAKKRAGQKAMAAALAAQTRVKEDAKAAELEAKRRYKKEEERLVEAWKAEELAKLERRAAATEKLKEERRAQMRDKTSRLEAQIEAKKAEDAALRRALAAQYRAKLVADAETRARVAEDTARLKASNAETLRIREEQARKEAEDDLMYQALYAEKLAKQEAESLANIQAVKDKQNALSANVGDLSKPLGARRYYAEETIARNAAIADARAAAREEADSSRARALARSTKLELAEQIRAKQERLDRERAEAARRHERFARVVDHLERAEKSSAADARAGRVAHLAELEAQMRDNQTRKAVFPMTETERALNSGLLSRVRGEAGAM
jgi:hypothetical protein